MLYSAYGWIRTEWTYGEFGYQALHICLGGLELQDFSSLHSHSIAFSFHFLLAWTSGLWSCTIWALYRMFLRLVTMHSLWGRIKCLILMELLAFFSCWKYKCSLIYLTSCNTIMISTHTTTRTVKWGFHELLEFLVV